jgi:trehalose 6-phosphate synthase/phosphatase
MARECQKDLEQQVATKWDVDVMPGKANLEVRPTFINKGEIVKRLVTEYNSKGDRVEFALCMGDDFTDEDMFRALATLSVPADDGHSELKEEQVFTVTVGASTKVTLAKWHLLEPEDVIDCVALLAGTVTSGGAVIGQVNLAALSAVEGKIPDVN